jgi:sigma-B regulation protein RsbU (phosphoserine phosphatase)
MLHPTGLTLGELKKSFRGHFTLYVLLRRVWHFWGMVGHAFSTRVDVNPPDPTTLSGVIRRVLVVDDSRVQRKILSASLLRWGYDVVAAGSAAEALKICAHQPVDLVISDWMMPEMDGLEFCRAFRALPRDSYGYFILLTSKSEKGEIAVGLDAGADDFLTKPVYADELRARIMAGERILRMERELSEKNRMLGETLVELQSVYQSLDRDLAEARQLQMTLVHDRHRDFGRASVSLLLRPSGHIGGDLVGYFQINARRVAMYSIDVSGHGVAAAFLAARLAGLLSTASANRNIAMAIGAYGQQETWPPEMVAAHFNKMMLEELHVDQYFTMAYAEADLITGKVVMVQAGHPYPALVHTDGRVAYLGEGGLPIGLIEGARYSRIETSLAPGERLFLMSDGITEAEGPDGRELCTEGLSRLITRNAALPGELFLEALVRDLCAFQGHAEFRDDVSGVLFTFQGPHAPVAEASG